MKRSRKNARLKPLRSVPDTIVVPSHPQEIDRVFLGMNCWYPVKADIEKLQRVNNIAIYATAPISAVTHMGKIDRVEPYKEGGYKIVLSGVARAIRRVPSRGAPGGLRSLRYTTWSRLQAAKTIMDL